MVGPPSFRLMELHSSGNRAQKLKKVSVRFSSPALGLDLQRHYNVNTKVFQKF